MEVATVTVTVRRVGFTKCSPTRKIRRLRCYETAGAKRPNVSLFTMPAFDPNEKAALLSRTAEVSGGYTAQKSHSATYYPFLAETRNLVEPVINAIFKKYQEVSEIEGHSHWAVLSS
jgi:hypothetical protein